MAPAIAPPTTFLRSEAALRGALTRSIAPLAVASPLAGYDSSPMATDVTRKTARPFAGGSPPAIDVTSRTTFAPAGISAPFVPRTGEPIVAVRRSPGRLLRVQTRALEVAANTAPPPMPPAPDPPPCSGVGAGRGAGSS